MKKIPNYLFWIVSLLLLLPSYVSAETTTLLVDVSGSMNGLSSDRNIHSLNKVKDEVSSFANIYKDSIEIVTFTDKILDTFVITPKNFDKEIYQNYFLPKKGNTNLNVALNYVENTNSHNIVLISDGKHNIGNFVPIIENLNNHNNRNQFFLLLDESDLNTPLLQELSSSNNIKFISSLSDILNTTTEVSEDREETISESSPVPSHLNTEDQKLSIHDNKSHVDLFKIFMWIIIGVIILVIILLLLKFIISILPLFLMNSVQGIQKAITILFNLPKPIFNIIGKLLPTKMRDFIFGVNGDPRTAYMPSYDNYKRGNVQPDPKSKNYEKQKQLLDEHKRKTGKSLKYKNGEPDFSDIAEYEQPLKGGLDSNVPQGNKVRPNVHYAQDKAADAMMKSKQGSKVIGDYVGKKPNSITYEDYQSWKEDRLNNGANPKTPHEKIDGTGIQWVPTDMHDTFKHTGGVSMTESIRNFFGLNI